MPDYEIIEIWEHEWDWACKNDETVKSFLKENEILDPYTYEMPCQVVERML